MIFCEIKISSVSYLVDKMGHAKQKYLRACANCTDSDSYLVRAKSHPVISLPFIYSVIANDSVSGQQRPCSDCADAQADLGLRCMNIPEEMFSLGAAQIMFTPVRELHRGDTFERSRTKIVERRSLTSCACSKSRP